MAQLNDRIIFTWSNEGERQFIMEPRGRKENANFLILYQGRDWSGFQTFAEVQETITQLEKERPKERLYEFDVVER
jgi:hypothetical protein